MFRIQATEELYSLIYKMNVDARDLRKYSGHSITAKEYSF